MLVNLKLNREISDLEAEIELLEEKRTRSQAALLDAVLDGVEPNGEDMDYFQARKAAKAYYETRRENIIIGKPPSGGFVLHKNIRAAKIYVYAFGY